MRIALIPALLRVALTTAILATALALPAGASPQSDFDAVYADWKPDGDVAACRFSQTALENAYNAANSSPDFQYDTRFSDEVTVEINRWKNGGCAGVQPLVQRRVSPLHGARIVSVKGTGRQSAEVVRIRNTTTKTLGFRRATLRNARSGTRNRALFPARFRLARGKTATVRVGCAAGKRRASFKGLLVWLCRKSPLYRDRGDLARLADAQGVVVSQRGFGSRRRTAAF